MNQIETTRRAMYSLLAELKPLPQIQGQVSALHEFEQAMEDHLEALRREMRGLKSDVCTAESAHDQSQKIVRVLKAQVATLLGELDEARADRSKYRQWMRSAVRQNRAERQNVKAFRETQEELFSTIARLELERLCRMGQERTGVHVSGGFSGESPKVKACTFDPSQNAVQEVK